MIIHHDHGDFGDDNGGRGDMMVFDLIMIIIIMMMHL